MQNAQLIKKVINILHIITIILFVIYMVLNFYFIRKEKSMYLIIPFYIPQLWTVLSVYYIETNAIFITEQDRYAFFTGATIKLLALLIIFTLGTFLSLSFLYPYRKKYYAAEFKLKYVINNKTVDSEQIQKFVVIVCLIISIILLSDGLITHLLNLGKVDRFNYINLSILANYLHLGWLYNFIYPIPFILGLLSTKKEYHKPIVVTLILLVIVNILKMDKFTPFYQMGMYLCSSILFNYPGLLKILKRIKLNKFILYSIIVLILLLFIVMRVISVYQKQFHLNLADALSAIEYRILGLQGHLWWGTDLMNDQVSDIERIQAIKQEFYATIESIKGNDKNIKGIQQLMIHVSPQKGWLAIENGVNFTMGYPAILIYLFGDMPAFSIIFLHGILYGLLIHILLLSYLKQRYPSLLLLSIVYVNVNYYLVMGTININTTFLFSVILLLIIRVLFWGVNRQMYQTYKK
ncbi:hypothetical protein APP_34720 [Aeribacillus pallidus]|nr:hypothetical protein APP_34720 [Aeribacillus pallidus]